MPAAERAFAALRAFVGRAPRGDIHIVVVPDGDLTNGLATPIPRNVIRIYPLPPRHVSLLQEYADWIDLLVSHEMLHIFHLDWAELPASIWRVLFGRSTVPTVTFSWGGALSEFPLGVAMPNVLLPDTFTEGWAVWAETALTGTGRAASVLSLSLLRNLVRDDALPGLGAANGWRRQWPGAQSGYQLGGAFHRDREAKQPGGWAETYRINARGCTPFCFSIPFGFGQERIALGAWADFEREEAAQQAAVDAARAPHREGEPLAGPWQNLAGPRFLADGTLVATVDDGLRPAHTGVIGPDGVFRPLFRRTGGRVQAGASVDDLVFDALAYLDDQVLVSELWTWDGRERVARTAGAHAFDPDRTAGALVFVERDGARECLVYWAELRTRWCAEPFRAVLRPRLSPDGRKVVFAHWTPAGRHDIWRWRPGQEPEPLTVGPDEDWLPAWGPDGRTVYAVRTPDGVPDLYRRDPETGLWDRLTRSRHGVWEWDLAPDGHTVVYSAPGGDGWRLYRLDLASQAPLPMPATAPVDPRLPPPSPGRAAAPVNWADEAPYRAWRTLAPTAWSPTVVLGGSAGSLLGARIGGQDVLGTWLWTAAGLWEVGGLGSAALALGRAEGRRESRVSATLFPEDGIWRLRGEGMLRRRWRRTVERTLVGDLYLAAERDFVAYGADLEPGLRLAWDGRQPFTWNLIGGQGMAARAVVAADLPTGAVVESGDGRGELIIQAGTRLFGRTQGRLALAGGGQARGEGRLDYDLWALGAGSFSPRGYVSRALAHSLFDVDRFALADAEFVAPLWWPQAGPGVFPLMVDNLALRAFAAAAVWQRDGAEGGDAALGAELGGDTIFGYGWLLPLRVGVRRGVAGSARDAGWAWYLGVGYSFDAAGSLAALPQGATW